MTPEQSNNRSSEPRSERIAVDARKKVLTLAEEFQAFALKGNVVDLAVGVIIGAAFTKIVDSLVSNVLMPLVNCVMPTGQLSYTDWAIEINGSLIPFGKFLGDVVNFFLVALVLFFLIRKFLAWVLSLHHHEAAKAETPPLTRDQELLTEIRDLLKKDHAQTADVAVQPASVPSRSSSPAG
jgi:large conductance mechanosensitive channel